MSSSVAALTKRLAFVLLPLQSHHVLFVGRACGEKPPTSEQDEERNCLRRGSSLSNSYFSAWIRYVLILCCFTRLLPIAGQLYCNATWDGWGCWNYTVAGKRAFANCPSFIDGFDSKREYNTSILVCSRLSVHRRHGIPKLRCTVDQQDKSLVRTQILGKFANSHTHNAWLKSHYECKKDVSRQLIQLESVRFPTGAHFFIRSC